ncbi:hypothetical protein AK830_g3630 [Neonectria ditissima]|uniref:Uncharacterized protein n=1 Tax=Neonectria ditissima TaxID=78410 RepID=A0A0P7BPY2_9HYPO|nr:hypothetical protein AK830_g3630 [Neonectria ditissima]
MNIDSSTNATVTRFSYFQWRPEFTKEKPYYLYIDPPEGEPVTNFTTAPGPEEVVNDIRKSQHDFNLDDHGFMVMQQTFSLPSINQKTVEELYLPSLEVMLRHVVGEEAEIVWFDWRTRSSNKSKTRFPEGTKIHLDDRSIPLEPVKAVHVGTNSFASASQDQSPTAAINRVYRHSGPGADELLKGRVRIINIWRPYGDPVESDPIAVMDGSYVPTEKLVEVDVVRHSYIGESYYPLQDDDYRWYLVSKQRSNEVLLFKMFDSDVGVNAKCTGGNEYCVHIAPVGRRRQDELVGGAGLAYGVFEPRYKSLFFLLDLRDGSATSSVTITTTTPSAERREYTLDVESTGSNKRAIHHLAAKAVLTGLENEVKSGATETDSNGSTVRANAEYLGTEYAIASKWTSFVVVEGDAEEQEQAVEVDIYSAPVLELTADELLTSLTRSSDVPWNASLSLITCS